MYPFDQAVEILLEREGPETDSPIDSGGRTRFGISTRAHPEVDLDTLTREQAVEIYRREYWLEPRFDRIAELAPRTAAAAFDFNVTAPYHEGVRVLQRALARLGTPATIDGIAGPGTLAAVRWVVERVGDAGLLELYRAEAARHYLELAERRPKDRAHVRGWLNRLFAIAGRREVA